MNDNDIPPALKQIGDLLIRAIQSGQDIDEAIAEVRSQLLEQLPGKEAEVDTLLEGIKQALGELSGE